MNLLNLKLNYLNQKTSYDNKILDVVTTSTERNYYFSDRPEKAFKSVSSHSKMLLPKYLAERFSKQKEETPAMKQGTHIHLFLENYFTKNDKALNEMKVTTQQAIHCRNLSSYIENNFTEVCMMESVVRSDIYEYAGRIDFLGVSDGMLTLVDFKVASAPSKLNNDMCLVYLFQLACYANALIESGYDVKRVMLLRSLPMTRRYNIIKKNVEEVLPLLPKYLAKKSN